MPTSLQLASGLGGAIGCDFRAAQNQLIFVEYSTGKLSALNLSPPSAIVAQSSSTILKGTWTFDFDTGVEGPPPANADVFWEQATAVLRSMVPQNSAKIINLGAVDYNTLTAAYLQKLPYSTTPIDGNDDSTNQLAANDVFAVLTTKGNYAKVQVITYGYDLTIRWVTYSIGSGYVVLGTGYNQPEDVRLSVDGVHAYVTERTGDLVKVALSSANRSAATVVATGMTAPQQLFLDEAHHAAYVVEYASAGSLLKVNLTSGVKTVVTALDNPVGLVLSSDLQYAYVSEQTTGPDLGRISQIKISGPTRTTLAKGLTNPFFLTWADAAQDSLLVPQRDPANSIVSVNVTSGATNVVASGVPFRPSSVALPYAGEMLICSDSVIEEISFTPFAVDGPLLLGIGYIPAADVNASGFATTPAGSIYQVTNAPFGGTLPIIINYPAATGAAYYQVRVDGVPQTDSFTVYTGFPQVLITVPAQTIGGKLGCFPVAGLFTYFPPGVGYLLDSTSLSNGLHHIVIQLLDGGGNPTVQSLTLAVLVNNQSCVAVLSPPVVNPSGKSADACGVLHYGGLTAPTVSLPYTASQPANFAFFSFALVRGVTPVPPPPTLPGGPVSTAVSPIVASVSELMRALPPATAPCTMAGFAVELYVAATMTNGNYRQSQYDAEALMGFALTP